MVTLDEDTYAVVKEKLSSFVSEISEVAKKMNSAAIDCVDNTNDVNAKKASDQLSKTAATLNAQAAIIIDVIADMDREINQLAESQLDY